MQTAYDDEVCFRAVERIRELSQRPDRRPFFLVASFTNPHDPWEVRRRYWDAYRDDEIDLPAVAPIPRAEADPHSRAPARHVRHRRAAADRCPGAAGAARLLRGDHATWMSWSARCSARWPQRGSTDETIVVFTADHGEMAGERGLWFKMSFLDGSARMPFLWRGPGIVSRTVAGPVSQLDLAPTLAEIAGAGLSETGFDRRSLLPALRGGALPDATVTAEYLAEGVTAPAVMLRRGPHKLVRCPGDPDLLYDLEADPRELHDLAGDPSRARVRDEMGAEAERRWDLAGLREQVLESQAQRRLVAAALATRRAHALGSPTTLRRLPPVRARAGRREPPSRRSARARRPASPGGSPAI